MQHKFTCERHKHPLLLFSKANQIKEAQLSQTTSSAAAEIARVVPCKNDSLGYIFVSDRQCGSAVNLTQLARITAVLHETSLTQLLVQPRNDGHWLFKVTQGHRFWYRSNACMRLPISEYLVLSMIDALCRIWTVATALSSSVPRTEQVVG